MTNQIIEGSLIFEFNDDIKCSKYDDWAHYKNQFQNKCSTDNKAMDIIAYRQSDTVWLCEIKDFRIGARNRDKLPLEQEIAQKARDSLAGLVSAKFHANDSKERQFAKQALACEHICIVLHIEQPSRRIYDLSDLQDKLRRLLKAIDPHVLVVDKSLLDNKPVYSNKLSWKVLNANRNCN